MQGDLPSHHAPLRVAGSEASKARSRGRGWGWGVDRQEPLLRSMPRYPPPPTPPRRFAGGGEELFAMAGCLMKSKISASEAPSARRVATVGGKAAPLGQPDQNRPTARPAAARHHTTISANTAIGCEPSRTVNVKWKGHLVPVERGGITLTMQPEMPAGPNTGGEQQNGRTTQPPARALASR